MSIEQRIDPHHGEVRGALRIAGPLVLAGGVMLIVIGFVSLFSSMGTYQPPRYFWCAFVGVPVLFLGIVMTAPAFLGNFSRFLSAEVAPVHRDTFNAMAEGTREGVRSVAEAVGQGLAAGSQNAEAGRYVACPGCRQPNIASNQYCNQCGSPLGVKVCSHCGARSDSVAHFCHQCGGSIG